VTSAVVTLSLHSRKSKHGQIPKKVEQPKLRTKGREANRYTSKIITPFLGVSRRTSTKFSTFHSIIYKKIKPHLVAGCW